MSKYDHPHVNKDGWTDWWYPTGQAINESDYKTSCCDCGLVHRFQFRLDDLPGGDMRLVMRVKRDERATAAVRRERKKKVAHDA